MLPSKPSSRKIVPFWAFDGTSHESYLHETVEATFVDDSAIALVASSPKALVKAITTLLETLTSTYTKFALKINFQKGKTEGMLRLRGKNSSATLESLKKNGIVGFDLPEPYSDHRLNTVEKYKHLGSFISLTEPLMFDAQHRASAALTAFVPLANRIFGSRHMGVLLKLHFMQALVLTVVDYPGPAGQKDQSCIHEGSA